MRTREDGYRIARELMLRTTTVQLAERFEEHFTYETIERLVEEVTDELERRFKVKTHLPTFALRFSRERLEAMAAHRGKIVDHKPSVLFVCHRNDGISQMAAALFRARTAGRAVVHSAGTQPAGELLDAAVHALHEVGIDLLEQFPKPLTREIEQAADVIVTLDAHDAIELVENDSTQYRAWRVSDDHGDELQDFRDLRLELEPLIDSLVADVVDTPTD